jgi:hypothetical protein
MRGSDRRSAVLGLALIPLLGGCSSPTTSARVALEIETSALPGGAVGEPYAEAVRATGGDGAYTWDIVSGALPEGLTLSVDDLAADNALITGTPVEAGTASFTVRVRSGDGQTATRQFVLPVAGVGPLAILTQFLPPALAGGPYSVQLRAEGGGAAQSWQLVGGTLPAGLTLTQAGRLEGTPTSPGTTTITVQVSSGATAVQATFELRVVAEDTAAYRIRVVAVEEIPAGVQAHLDVALQRWEAAIIGNLQPVAIPTSFFGPNGCGGFGQNINGTAVDDILIIIHITPIDGPGGVLGRAGPCGVRQNNTLPFAGIVTLDLDDLMPVVGTETLTDIITHEIAHVLGFGSLWEAMGLISGAGGPDPRYTGALGSAEYQALGGTGFVPLETLGGEGTRDGHWRKSVFGIELMTGFAEPIGVAQPISRVTIAQWQDMGYTVNMGAAAAFTLSSATSQVAGLRAAGHGPLGHDEIYDGPVYVLHRDGRASVLGEGGR